MTFAAFRNLYKLWADGPEERFVAAFITARDEEAARKTYREAGGSEPLVEVERISFGYPEDVVCIYA